MGCNCLNTMRYYGNLHSFRTHVIIATSVLISSTAVVAILFRSLILYTFGLWLFALMSSSNHFKLCCHRKVHFCIPIRARKLQKKIQPETCTSTACTTWCYLPCSSLFHNRCMSISPLLFTFNDFTSPLILFSWWRNKIS